LEVGVDVGSDRGSEGRRQNSFWRAFGQVEQSQKPPQGNLADAFLQSRHDGIPRLKMEGFSLFVRPPPEYERLVNQGPGDVGEPSRRSHLNLSLKSALWHRRNGIPNLWGCAVPVTATRPFRSYSNKSAGEFLSDLRGLEAAGLTRETAERIHRLKALRCAPCCVGGLSLLLATCFAEFKGRTVLRTSRAVAPQKSDCLHFTWAVA
jgi:hypothetical protein